MDGETADIVAAIARKDAQSAVVDACFPAQRKLVRDKSRMKAALCTRRAGKSYGIGSYLVDECLSHPGSTCLYVGLTRESAKRIIWKDVLRVINKKHALHAVWNKVELSLTFPNGSVIYVLGLDADEDEKQKALGQKYRLVVIDEAGSYSIDMAELVYEILLPATADDKGTICLIGTPSVFTKSLFYAVTTGKESGWSVHQWSALENPHIDWQAEIDELKARKPGIEETPGYRRMYMAEWVIDDEALVYRYSDNRNGITWEEWQKIRDDPRLAGSWHYVLGVDLGYEDADSFIVDAYNDHTPTLYTVEASKKDKLDITGTANRIKALSRVYRFDHVVVDGSNKKAVEEMKNRHKLSLEAADKAGKFDFIEIMNAEYLTGSIKIVAERCQPLVDEYRDLVKDPRKEVPTEHPACENHCADGALYAWRRCYQYLSQPKAAEHPRGTPEWLREDEERMRAAAVARIHKPSDIEPLGGDPWDTPTTW